jgi:hypothetical protein
LKPLRFPVFFMIFCSPPCSSRSFDFVGEGALDSFAALTRTVSSFAGTSGAGRTVAEAPAALTAGASGAFNFDARSSFAGAVGVSTGAALAEAAPPAGAASAPRGRSAPSVAKDGFFSAEPLTRDGRAATGLDLRGIPPGLACSGSGLDALVLVFLRAAIPHLHTRDEHSRAAPAARSSQSLKVKRAELAGSSNRGFTARDATAPY